MRSFSLIKVKKFFVREKIPGTDHEAWCVQRFFDDARNTSIFYGHDAEIGRTRVFFNEHCICYIFYPGNRLGVDIVISREQEEILRDQFFSAFQCVSGPQLLVLDNDFNGNIESGLRT